jgi:DeoR family transcriptional regulator, suf operon transcriptional repressor
MNSAATTPAPSEPVELAPTEAAGIDTGLNGFPPGTRRVLEALKLAGDASAEELASSLGITVSAVRQHIRPLEDQGLVAHRDQREGPGRPRRRYCLAPSADALWPKRYGLLANQLLGFIDQAAPKAVEEAFERRGRQRVERARVRLAGKSFDDRVRELAVILDEDGYLADCEKVGRGHWLVTEHNCAIVDVARQYGKACASELAFVRAAIPDASIERVAHLLAGAHVCAYDIRLQKPAPG